MAAAEKQGKNLSDIQEINRSLVLNTLREKPDSSRSAIAQITGLQQATITKIVNDFIDWGIVSESGLLKSSGGRRSIGLRLNSNQYRIISVRLQRTNITAGLYDIAGKGYTFIKEPIEIARGAEAAVATMISVIRALIAEAEGNTLLGIGIGLPGPYLRDRGIITVMADFPGWEGKKIQEQLENEFGPIVYAEHDAQANALAEWWFGRQREGETTLLSVSMEEGLGAGLILNGKPYFGKQGIAGEIGHISIDYNGLPCPCGSRGCLRNYCSDTAVLRIAHAGRRKHPESSLYHREAFSLADVIDAAKKGDSYAVSLLHEAGTNLGYGLINVIYMYNPGVIVLSRQFSGAGDLFLDAVRDVLRRRLPKEIADAVRVVFSSLTEDPVLMGMAALVTDSAFKTPSEALDIRK